MISLVSNQHRASIAKHVLVIHGQSKILNNLPLCKMTSAGSCMTNTCFAMLALCWLLTRLIIFPYHVIASPFSDFYPVYGHEGHEWMDLIVVLLSALFVLHVHWFWLIIQTFVKALKNKKMKDTHSETDEESEDEKVECKQ